MGLLKYLEESYKRIDEEDIEEGSVTGGGEAYDTPFAFDDEDEEGHAEDYEVFDYEKAKETHRHTRDIEEGSQTGTGERLGGYKAFQGTGKIKHKNSGYEEAEKSSMNFKESKMDSDFKKLAKSLFEISYQDYKKDETLTPKQKVNTAIHEMDKRLREIEQIVRHNSKLKQEAGINTGQYWKSSQVKLNKITERMLKIARQLREFNS